MEYHSPRITRRVIRQVVRQIAERFHPLKVILFGSYAHGKPTPDSDVDLLVIMETDRQPLHAAGDIAAAIEHSFPIDILVFRPADWAAYLKEKASFQMHVAEKGIVLYEAVHSGVA